MSTGFWGADTTNEQKPNWAWLLEQGGNSAANVFATNSGWTYRWPFGDEVVVAIEGLARKLGTANVVGVFTDVTGDGPSLELTNTTTQALVALVSFNEPVTVTGTPTLSMETSGTGTAANLTLSYNAAASDLTAGKVVFSNLNFSLAHADYANTDLTISNTSTLTGWDGIKDASTANAVANSVPNTQIETLHVYYGAPLQDATIRFGTVVTDAANQVLGIELNFTGELPLVVTGTPTIQAIATTTVTANVQLTYSANDSSLASGNVVFKSAAQTYAALGANGVYTVNSTSNVVNWINITDALGQRPANALVVANTIPVTVGPVEAKVWSNTAPANTTPATVTFGLQFDRAVQTRAPLPTLVAISNNQGLCANVTLAYASGNTGNTLIFSNTSAALAAGTNGVSFVINATSVLANFGSIFDNALGNTVAVRSAVLPTGNTISVATP